MSQTVVIGITSGIAAYKSLDLIRLLKKAGFDVFVIMTAHAARMVRPQDFEKASGNKVFRDLFIKNFNYHTILKTRKVDHIELADKADIFVIVPATANIIAKLAHGIADDFLTTTALAVTKPTIIYPSMNVNMWNNPATQENIQKLKKFGYQIVEPVSGMLACGYEGKGKLKDIKLIYDEILQQLNQTQLLKGKKVIVTAGGTNEKIDEVRSITNRSSGKMGVAIAEACHLRGADVLLLRSKTAVGSRYPLSEKIFTSANDLWTLIKENVQSYDILYQVAAVSDFQVTQFFRGKLSSQKPLTIRLKPQIKILDRIKKLRPQIFLIAFKAEYGLPEKELVKVSLERLKQSRADIVIANDISRNDRGFEADTNEVFVISPDATVQKIPHSSKREVAAKIVEHLHARFLIKK